MKFAAYLTFAAVAVATTQAGYGGGVQQSTAASNGGDCPTVCTDNYKPVCGSDGKTYSNSCNLNLANCQTQSEVTQVSDGVCPTTSSQPSSTGNSGSSACPDVCPAIYKPVCGSDGNTYSNDCELTVAQCKHDEDVTKVSDGQCPTSSSGSNGEGCPNVCFEIYQPVCGTDGVTYANSCFLDIANCHNPKITLASDKPCATGEGSYKTNDTSVDSSADTSVDSDSSSSSSSSSACPSFCTTEYAPVCGSDGDTYSNECKLEIASCNHPDKHITKASDGACSDGCKTGF